MSKLFFWQVKAGLRELTKKYDQLKTEASVIIRDITH